MKRYINYLLLSVFLAMLSACSDDIVVNPEPQPSDSEKPVAVTADFASWTPTSRAAFTLKEKSEFADGDVIHVQGEFELTDGSKVWRYDIYTYSGGRWLPKPDPSKGESSLKWPWNSVKGSFTAYYLPSTKEKLPDGESDVCAMGGNYLSHDPLEAHVDGVEREFAVNFTFKHMCTRLVIENTKNNYAEEYWFYKEGISNFMKLGFEPTVDEATGQQYNKLALTFLSNPDSNEGAVSAVKVMDSTVGTSSNAGYVVYYLEPGKYYGSDLNYSGNRLYLKLNVDALDEPEPGSDGLKAGRTYFLDIEKARGVINTEETDDPWDNDDGEDDEFNVQDFVDAVHDGKPFDEILKVDDAGNLVLTKNLNFRNEDFVPKDVPTNIVFDGGHHYIRNAKYQVFNNILGAVRNLEIRNAKIESYDSRSAGMAGALAAYNQGFIDNIRLRDNSFSLRPLIGSEEVTSVGGLVGNHTGGQISNVYMIGKHTMIISDEGSDDDTRGHLFFGGIAGQAGGTSPAIKNVSMLQDENGDAPVISLKLNCRSGIYSVGGVVGRLATGIEDCTLAVTLDCSDSTPADCCVGGLFGREETFGNSGHIEISNCNVSGVVRGAYVTTVLINSNIVTGRSITGGIGGAVQYSNLLISDCRSFCDVYDCFNIGHSTSTVKDEVYGTGGAFGRLTAQPKPAIRNCTAWGQVYGTKLDPTAEKGGSCVGSFVGYAYGGFLEEDLNGNGNAVNSINGSLPVCGYNWIQ